MPPEAEFASEPQVRRRGAAFLQAVREAALAEIAENGLRGATMEGIARRAGTGKSSLYRRWRDVRALALDVFIRTMQDALPSPDATSGSLREDLLTSMTTLSRELEGDLGVVLRELISEGAHDSSLVEEFQRRFGLPKQAELMTMLQLAITRGDIPPQAVDPYVLQLPAALVMHRLVMTGSCPTEDEVEHIVDRIVLPLLLLGGSPSPS